MELSTDRLVLNAFDVSEASKIATLAGDIRVVEMTASIPYPYEPPMAVSWIETHQKGRDEGANFVFAIRLKDSLELIGCINIAVNQKHQRGYLGYWIGFDFWGKGHATEAVKELIRFGFEEKKLNKIWAEHKTFNIGSGKVMEKAGMTHEGVMRNHYKQGDEFLDMSVKSILREEFSPA